MTSEVVAFFICTLFERRAQHQRSFLNIFHRKATVTPARPQSAVFHGAGRIAYKGVKRSEIAKR